MLTKIMINSFLRMTNETSRENLELYNLIRIYVKLKKVYYPVNYGAYFHRAIRMVMNGI